MAQKMGHIAFLVSVDPDLPQAAWAPVMPHQVPASIQDPDVIGNIIAETAKPGPGFGMAMAPEDQAWYTCVDMSAAVEQADG